MGDILRFGRYCAVIFALVHNHGKEHRDQITTACGNVRVQIVGPCARGTLFFVVPPHPITTRVHTNHTGPSCVTLNYTLEKTSPIEPGLQAALGDRGLR